MSLICVAFFTNAVTRAWRENQCLKYFPLLYQETDVLDYNREDYHIYGNNLNLRVFPQMLVHKPLDVPYVIFYQTSTSHIYFVLTLSIPNSHLENEYLLFPKILLSVVLYTSSQSLAGLKPSFPLRAHMRSPSSLSIGLLLPSPYIVSALRMAATYMLNATGSNDTPD